MVEVCTARHPGLGYNGITKNGHAIAKPVNPNVSAVNSIRGMLKGLSLDFLRFFPVSIASYSLSLNATRL